MICLLVKFMGHAYCLAPEAHEEIRILPQETADAMGMSSPGDYRYLDSRSEMYMYISPCLYTMMPSCHTQMSAISISMQVLQNSWASLSI